MIVVDVETTGLDDKLNSIVSVGALDYYNPEDRFYGECRIIEGTLADYDKIKFALGINGFTLEEITDPNKKSAGELAKEYIDWASEKMFTTLAGHNPRFDLNFLAAAARSEGHKWPFGYHSIDLHSLAYNHMEENHFEIPANESGASLVSGDFVMEYVGLPQEPKPHNALNGAIWETEAFYRIKNGYPYLDQFRDYPVPDYLKKR